MEAREGAEESGVGALFQAVDGCEVAAAGEVGGVVLSGFPSGGRRPTALRHDRRPGRENLATRAGLDGLRLEHRAGVIPGEH